MTLWRQARPPAQNHCHPSFPARGRSNATPWSDVKTLFSTAEVGSRDRFALWHDVACKTIVGHDTRPGSRSGFRAVLGYSDLAGMGMMVLENSPMTVNRTRRDSARTPDDSLFLCRQLSGDLGLEQQGRAIVLGPGEMTLLDAQRVYRGDFRAGSRLMVLKMPRRAMEARCGDLTALLAQKARPHAGVGSVISGHVAMLEQGTETMDLPAQTVVREYTLDLIALSLAATASHSATRLSRLLPTFEPRSRRALLIQGSTRCGRTWRRYWGPVCTRAVFGTGHLDHAVDPRATAGPLQRCSRRLRTPTPYHQRHCLRMGFLRPHALWPLVQKAFRHASARISRRAATAGALGAISPAGPRRALSYWASMAT